jgi:HD-GYP domain-containing protein (c-di-GMP phosphodiesterase class II)
MVHLVTKEIRVSGCAVYIYNKPSKAYRKEISRGFRGQETIDDVKKDSSFTEWLVEKRQPLNYSDLTAWMQGGKLFSQRLVLKRTLEQIRVTMKKMGSSLCVPSFLKGEMIGFMILGEKLSGAPYTRDDISLLSTLSNNAAIALENARMYEELQARINKLNHLYQEEHSLFIDAASAFSYAIDAKDGYTQTHTLKMTDYAFAITKELENLMPYVDFDEHFYDTLKIASILHDIGKIGVPDQILKKQGNLTEEERAQLMKHTLIGENILHPIREIEEVFSLIRHHHENYDGTGYPDGLRGHSIPLISRIIAVANSYDTMTSDRPYRKAMPKEQVIEEIRENSGTQFDPLVVEAFIRSIGTSKDTTKI